MLYLFITFDSNSYIPMSLRKRNSRLNQDQSEDSQNLYQPTFDPSSENKRPEETRTRAAKNNPKINYNVDDLKKSMEEEQQAFPEQMQAQEIYTFLTPKVECLLWKLDHEDPEQEKYLVKFDKRSYHQATWKTRQQLRDIAYEIGSNTQKSLKNKMRKAMDLKLSSGDYFNPNFKIPDRILSSTEVFTAIHHKRANDIKGKWDETILMVGQKLVNFVKDGYPYGVVMHEPYNQELEKAQGITTPINIGQIINKVYLGYFKKYAEYWQELGRAINNFLLIYPQAKGDYHILGQTIKQCGIFAYAQWYKLSKQRYIELEKELTRNNVIAQKMINQQQENEEIPKAEPAEVRQNGHEGETKDSATQSAETKTFLKLQIVAQYCQSNILLTEKCVDPPKNQEELQLLNPGQFSYSWLDKVQPEKYKSYTFKYITSEDLKVLDLNTETDKLYYIKWKDMSYNDATWESQKIFACPQKIEEFKTYNKIPVKDIREKFEVHNKIHKFLLQYNQYIGDKKNSNYNANIAKMETKMYRLDAGQKGEPRQYGDKDIPIFKNYRKLKEFQLESLNWLIKSWYENRNTILADEMGLGKTIQTIAFLYHLYTYEGVIGPFLVLAPLTTLQQWRRQIEEWTNFNCLLYYDEGKSNVREIIQQYEFFHLHTTKTGDIITSKLPKFQILLTNYELFINDFEILNKIPYQHIVLDEAHRLKNKTTKTTITLSKMPCVRKTLLTGTPIQNNTKELWTLLNFIEPKTFNSEEKFLEEYGALSTEEQVKNFKKMLKPYLLRRVKEDVQSTIPKLSETIVDVEMSARQKAYYKGVVQKNKTSMLKGLTTANFNSISIQLRKCCNHPYLVSPQVQDEIKFGAVSVQQETQRFISSSGKTILLMKLLQKFKKQGKKVLLFSQFVAMLELLKPYLEIKGYNCEMLTGSQTSTNRHQAITRFNENATDVFLISTKAGGVGINLVAATEIIIYDSDWNPQNDIQATARAHRIGQKKQVNVYRLIIANSYESEMFQMSSKKLGLDKAIFTGDTFKSMGEFDQAEKQLTKDEIQMLLKKGIIGFLDNQMNEDEFFNQSIEDILQKNARRVEYSVSQNVSVSKTKFKSDEGNNIQLDAPDFWQQALKCFESPLDKLVKKRSQLKEFSTLQQQQALLLQTYRIVLDFVKQKTLGAGFNAEDQRKLQKFLEAINSERHINRHLRDIADQLSMEIQKPSRRFKVKEEDIFDIDGTIKPETKKQNPPEKVTRSKTSKKMELQNMGLDDIGEDQISGVEEELQTPEDETQKKDEQEQSDDDYEKLCFLCEKPKCTIFCKGPCIRCFHRKCFEIHSTGQISVPETYQLDELSMDFQKWKESKSYDKKCVNCETKDYRFKCWVCLKEGNYYEEEPISSRSKRAKARRQIKEQDYNAVYKCSFPGKCHRFYHLNCLFSAQFENKFSDHTGRIIKDVSTPTKQFRCPSHYCSVCYGSDPKSTKMRSHNCIRCCRTFHDKCLNKEQFIRLGSDHYYICASHLSKGADVDKISLQIKKFRPSKRDKISQKRRLKQTRKNREAVATTKNNEEPQTPRDKTQSRNQMESSAREEDSRLRRSKRHKNAELQPFPELQPEKKERKSHKSQKKEKSREKKEKKADKTEMDIEQNQQPVKEPAKEEYVESKQQSKSKNSSRSKQKKSKRHESGSHSDLNSSKKMSKQLQSKLEHQYKDFGLTPISEFDFSTYSYPWCRYCGSRFATGFQAGPWQGSTLCEHHCQQWKKDRLHLSKYKSEPKKPINKNKQNQLKYLNEYASKNKLKPDEAIIELKKKLGIE